MDANKKNTKLVDYYNAFIAEPVTSFATGLAKSSLDIANIINPEQREMRKRWLENIQQYKSQQKVESRTRLNKGMGKNIERAAWGLRGGAHIAGRLLPSYAGMQLGGSSVVGLANRMALSRGALSARSFKALKDIPYVPKLAAPIFTYGDEIGIATYGAAEALYNRNKKSIRAFLNK